MEKMKMINLQVSKETAKKLYKEASPEMKAIIEKTVPEVYFLENSFEQIKSYEDACRYLGTEPMNDDWMRVIGFRSDEIDRRKLETITFALNEGEFPDWNNEHQEMLYPWFDFSDHSGFAFGGTSCHYSYSFAGIASRLCFKDEKRARYAGETFTDLYRSIIDNKDIIKGKNEKKTFADDSKKMKYE